MRKRPSTSRGKAFAPLAALDLGEETEAAQVDAQDGDAQRGAQVPGAQHGAVTAQGDQQVELAVFDALDQRAVEETAPLDVRHPGLLQERGDHAGLFRAALRAWIRQNDDALRRCCLDDHTVLYYTGKTPPQPLPTPGGRAQWRVL